MPKALRLRNKVPNYSSPRVSPYYIKDEQAPTETYLRAYQRSGTVYGMVDLFASAVAFPEWRLYRKNTDNRVRYSTTDTGSDNRTEVLQHQALRVLNNPNPFMTRLNLFEISQTYMELAGESWWIIDYTGPIPTSIWPVRPDAMQVVPDPSNFLKGYIYNGPDNEKIPFQPNEVILVKMPNPLNIYRGQSWVQTVLADIESGEYAAQYNRNFFYNDASPGGVIEAPGEVTDEEFDQLTNRWRETHRGMSRAHRVAILENGMTFNVMSPNAKDMDFVNLVRSSKDSIREGARVHPSMLGQVQDVNRANAVTAQEVHNDTQTVPRLERWKDALNFQYLPLFGSTGQGVEFDYMPPVPKNRELDNQELVSKAQAASVLVTAGWNPDDVLEFVGIDHMDFKKPATPAPAPQLPMPRGPSDPNGEPHE